MKKSKLTALTMAVTMMATAFVGTMTANAEDVLIGKGNVEKGIDLVYNQTKSTATERYVDVYINGAVDISVMSFKFQTTYGVLTNGGKSELFESYDSSLAALPTNGLNINTSKEQSIYSGGFNNTATEQLFGGGYFGTLKLTVDDAADTFDIEVMSASYVSEYTTGSAVKIKFSNYDKLTVPEFATAPVEPEKDAFTPVTAEPGDVYDADKSTVPVKVWSTDIDYSTTKVEGKLVWAVKNAEGEVAKVDAATVSGEATVVYGIAIAGQAAELDTIESVELTVE